MVSQQEGSGFYSGLDCENICFKWLISAVLGGLCDSGATGEVATCSLPASRHLRPLLQLFRG